MGVRVGAGLWGAPGLGHASCPLPWLAFAEVSLEWRKSPYGGWMAFGGNPLGLCEQELLGVEKAKVFIYRLLLALLPGGKWRKTLFSPFCLHLHSL